MPRVIWSPQTLKDVQRLYRFLAPKDEVAARRAIRVIRSGVKILALQPEVGRPMEGMEPSYREWTIDFGNSDYVALYHFDGETAVILVVKHQKEVGY